MKDLKAPYQELVMICTNVRPPGSEKPSCGDHGAPEMRARLKKALKAQGLWGKRVRVVTTGCLDVCPHAGFICSFDRGESLVLVHEDQDAQVLARIEGMVNDG